MTTNAGKFVEVSRMLREAGIEVTRLDRSYPELQADSLDEVLRYAEGVLAREVGGDFLADDSGLFVEALKGFPGVQSHHTFRTIGCDGILRLLEGVEDRAARFEARFLVHVGGESAILAGSCPGRIAQRPRGAGGFGFDPIFVPEGSPKTFAEMTMDEKNEVSHRGRAVREVIRSLKSRRPA